MILPWLNTIDKMFDYKAAIRAIDNTITYYYIGQNDNSIYLLFDNKEDELLFALKYGQDYTFVKAVIEYIAESYTSQEMVTQNILEVPNDITLA